MFEKKWYSTFEAITCIEMFCTICRQFPSVPSSAARPSLERSSTSSEFSIVTFQVKKRNLDFFEHFHRMNSAGYLRSSLGEEPPSRRWKACLPTTKGGPASTRSRWGEQALIRVSIFRYSQLIHPGCLFPWSLSKTKSFQRLSQRFSLHAEWQVSTARQWQMKNWSLADIDHKE